jgi:hypothetical protein
MVSASWALCFTAAHCAEVPQSIQCVHVIECIANTSSGGLAPEYIRYQCGIFVRGIRGYRSR